MPDTCSRGHPKKLFFSVNFLCPPQKGPTPATLEPARPGENSALREEGGACGPFWQIHQQLPLPGAHFCCFARVIASLKIVSCEATSHRSAVLRSPALGRGEPCFFSFGFVSGPKVGGAPVGLPPTAEGGRFGSMAKARFRRGGWSCLFEEAPPSQPLAERCEWLRPRPVVWSLGKKNDTSTQLG